MELRENKKIFNWRNSQCQAKGVMKHRRAEELIGGRLDGELSLRYPSYQLKGHCLSELSLITDEI